MLQLRNLINRRNVKHDISGKFNEAIDLFELVVTGYVIAATLHFFGMGSISDKPTRNSPPSSCEKSDRWSVLQSATKEIVKQYVVVHEVSYSELGHTPLDVIDPKVVQIALEHSATNLSLPHKLIALIHMLHVFFLNIVMSNIHKHLKKRKKQESYLSGFDCMTSQKTFHDMSSRYPQMGYLITAAQS